MPFKAEEPKASTAELFPKGAGAKPKEGGIPPSELCELEASMSGALSKIPPASAAAPRRAGMRQFFTGAQEWIDLTCETFPPLHRLWPGHQPPQDEGMGRSTGAP